MKFYCKRFKGKVVSDLSALSIAQRYGYPVPGSHPVKVAIISLGGGYAWNDIKTYCQKYDFPCPSVKDYSVDGAKNDYTGDPNSADGENALDIQNIIGATRGRVAIRVFICQNTDSSFANGVAAVAKMNDFVACSISWGLDERFGNHAAMDRALAQCKMLNIPVFTASGDSGSSDGDPGKNVDYPASSPYAVGCGGTTIASTDIVWSGSGGGISKLYRNLTGQPGHRRGVPDIAANADPNTGYPVVINGTWYTFGGTSSSAPLWAAGVACVASNTTQRIKNFIETIYKSKLLTDVTQGSNGAYKAAAGYDYCSGLGVPNKDFWAQFHKL